MSDIKHHPHFGKPLPNGKLLIPTSGRDENGERWDGQIEVAPDHPRYSEWLKAIEGKEEYPKSLSNKTQQAREERRKRKRTERSDG